tara:strand:- start:431 stop:1060 length:630 start_codon:yes stop_codon:yes gene_type:complete
MSGKFITVEGIEGAGKTTCMDTVQELLTKNSIEFITTREPGGTPLAEKIRALLLNVEEDTPASLTELLLIFASRAQHINKVIRPALSNGLWVLCDRFTDATYAYQGGGRGVKLEFISLLEKITQEGLRPHLTLLLDVSPELGMARVRKRGELDRFEKEKIEFFENVRTAYLNIAEKDPKRCITIDASMEKNNVLCKISEAITEKFSLEK